MIILLRMLASGGGYFGRQCWGVGAEAGIGFCTILGFWVLPIGRSSLVKADADNQMDHKGDVDPKNHEHRGRQMIDELLNLERDEGGGGDDREVFDPTLRSIRPIPSVCKIPRWTNSRLLVTFSSTRVIASRCVSRLRM
jgi:hypothetical protein